MTLVKLFPTVNGTLEAHVSCLNSFHLHLNIFQSPFCGFTSFFPDPTFNMVSSHVVSIDCF